MGGSCMGMGFKRGFGGFFDMKDIMFFAHRNDRSNKEGKYDNTGGGILWLTESSPQFLMLPSPRGERHDSPVLLWPKRNTALPSDCISITVTRLENLNKACLQT